MRKLKVFGGIIMYQHKQCRVIVATTSQKKAAEITKQTLNTIKNWFCITGNEKELKTALAEPHIMFVEKKINNVESNYIKIL